MIKTDFTIQPSDKELKHVLGKRADRLMKSNQNVAKYEGAKEDLVNLVKPAAGWKILEIKVFSSDSIMLDGEKLLGTSHFLKAIENASHLLIAVCTIGEAVEKRAKEYMNNNNTFKGFLLDGMASWAVGKVKNQFLDWVTDEVEARHGFTSSLPFSPGIGSWPMTDQIVVFDLLGEVAGLIGVRLTDSMIMVPVKSESMLLGLGRGQIDKIS